MKKNISFVLNVTFYIMFIPNRMFMFIIIGKKWHLWCDSVVHDIKKLFTVIWPTFESQHCSMVCFMVWLLVLINKNWFQPQFLYTFQKGTVIVHLFSNKNKMRTFYYGITAINVYYFPILIECKINQLKFNSLEFLEAWII